MHRPLDGRRRLSHEGRSEPRIVSGTTPRTSSVRTHGHQQFYLGSSTRLPTLISSGPERPAAPGPRATQKANADAPTTDPAQLRHSGGSNPPQYPSGRIDIGEDPSHLQRGSIRREEARITGYRPSRHGDAPAGPPPAAGGQRTAPRREGPEERARKRGPGREGPGRDQLAETGQPTRATRTVASSGRRPPVTLVGLGSGPGGAARAGPRGPAGPAGSPAITESSQFPHRIVRSAGQTRRAGCNQRAPIATRSSSC